MQRFVYFPLLHYVIYTFTFVLIIVAAALFLVLCLDCFRSRYWCDGNWLHTIQSGPKKLATAMQIVSKPANEASWFHQRF